MVTYKKHTKIHKVLEAIKQGCKNSKDVMKLTGLDYVEIQSALARISKDGLCSQQNRYDIDHSKYNIDYENTAVDAYHILIANPGDEWTTTELVELLGVDRQNINALLRKKSDLQVRCGAGHERIWSAL